MSSVVHVRDQKTARRSWFAAIKDDDLAIVLAFCLVGLLVTLNVMFRVPEFGAIFSQLN